jgi:hydrogenase expression/formation protein HypD
MNIDIFTVAYRDPQLARSIVRRIASTSQTPIRLMEVCGTHTMAIFRHGIRSLLPDTITLLSGPGCPVCVTDQSDIDAFVRLARRDDVVIATFGDLMRVPGNGSSLQQERADGADVRVVYSPLDAVQTAREAPEKKIIFLGVGFETTAPTIAAALITARRLGLDNFYVYPANKTVPPALNALMTQKTSHEHPPGIDGFLLPGHVSVIIGISAYQRFHEQFHTPCVVAGFEPVDILESILQLTRQIENGEALLANAYSRAVTENGNAKAKKITDEVFESCNARWRGIGIIPGSGLSIRKEFRRFDATCSFDLDITPVPEPKGCACGDILTGNKTPLECALFRTTCTPMAPVGPCMVSSEGTCSAYYRYHEA